MKAVGIKQLKARLSEYVRLVKSGETVLVTDREEVVAELRPARRPLPPGRDAAETLEALVGTGVVTPPAIPKEKGWTWKVKGLGLPPGTALQILDEIRADRV
ncbi:MAG: type II toxin-antitoxin system Phd/YefM family antitoxin [Planctomycetales bacterium]|nr:type II toxin-antitoxin system Phd/YefM family antitoxin [Planctomycetales bacterium]